MHLTLNASVSYNVRPVRTKKPTSNATEQQTTDKSKWMDVTNIPDDVQEELEACKAIYGEDYSDVSVDTVKLEIVLRACVILAIDIPANYPLSIPELDISWLSEKAVPFDVMLEMLDAAKDEAKNNIGSPMIFSIVSAASTGLDKFLEQKKKEEDKASAAAGGDTSYDDVCIFFRKGKCSRGDKCKFKHALPNAPKAPKAAAPPTTAAPPSSSSTAVAPPAVKAAPKSAAPGVKSTGAGSSSNDKLASMRPSWDVIARLKYDQDLPQSLFTVGYLDRFSGIQEKMFTDFDWENAIDTVDNNTLAIPQHRIEYFKYRDAFVWHKADRIDDFFGSLGGKKIAQAIYDYDLAHPFPSDDEGTDGDGSDNESETNASEATTEGDTGAQRDPTAALEIKKLAISSDSSRPNHYLCFRVTDPEILEGVKAVQSGMLQFNPEYERGMSDLKTLHVTLAMLRLSSEADIKRAQAALDVLQWHLQKMFPPQVEITFEGVYHFRDRVVYVAPSHKELLTEFVNIANMEFKKHNVNVIIQAQTYTPHMTIFKQTREMSRSMGNMDRASYLSHLNRHFGTQAVDAIHVASMIKPKADDGFAVREAGVSNVKLMAGQDVLMPGAEGKRLVVLMRGIPGSGKSYLTGLVQQYAAEKGKSCLVCSADHYFHNDKGEYVFDVTKLKNAHNASAVKFRQAVKTLVDVIIVDNTNTQGWEYMGYASAALKSGNYSVKVIEVSVKSLAEARTANSRNTHGVPQDAEIRMWRRFTREPVALRIPMWQPNDNLNRKEMVYQWLSNSTVQPQPPGSAVLGAELLYVGVLLNEESKRSLASSFKFVHETLSADHVTVHYKPSDEILESVDYGKEVTIEVIGHAVSDDIQAAAVRLADVENNDRTLFNHIPIPHITLSYRRGVLAKQSTALLADGYKSVVQPLTLTGRIGAVVKNMGQLMTIYDRTEMEEWALVDLTCPPADLLNTTVIKVTRPEERLEPPFALLKKTSSVVAPPLERANSVVLDANVVKTVHIFDFDGTLFNTPGPHEGPKEYTKLTGKKLPSTKVPFMLLPESLMPPMKITAGPALDDFRDHNGRASTVTIMMTGRSEVVMNEVKSVLHSAGLSPDRYVFRPHNNRKKAPVYKTEALVQLLAEYPEATLIKIWEDSRDNVNAFRSFAAGSGREFEIIDVTSGVSISSNAETSMLTTKDHPSNAQAPPAIQDSVLRDVVNRHLPMRSSDYQAAAEKGLKHITRAWLAILQEYLTDRDIPIPSITDNELPEGLYFPFGSYPLGRRSDIDVCLLVPEQLYSDGCWQMLYDSLQSKGFRFVYGSPDARVCRVHVKCEFAVSAPVEYDVVFAGVRMDVFTRCWVTDRESIFSQDLLKQIKDTRHRVGEWSAASALAFDGYVRLETITSRFSSRVLRSEFALLVDALVLLLRVKRQRGTAFHCARTFHLCEVVSEYIKASVDSSRVTPDPTGETEGTVTSPLDMNQLFVNLIHYLAQWDRQKWGILFDTNVPQQFTVKLATLLKESVDIMAQACGGSLTKVGGMKESALRSMYDKVFAVVPFPPAGYVDIQIDMYSPDNIEAWKMDLFCQARLPKQVRAMLHTGVDVVPEGFEGTRVLAVPEDSVPAAMSFLQNVVDEMSGVYYSADANVWLSKSIQQQRPGVPKKAPVGSKGGDTLPKAVLPPPGLAPALRSLVAKFVHNPNQTSVHLPPTLNRYDRMQLHHWADSLEYKHVSEGDGPRRHLVIYRK
eukprot:GFYU01006102.1.p1 GENE.GFYU01006102.1~~GFYU01006102.1.p1  ORF type:complete len:1730 (-),score=510.95 GFYU01006102.1:75-5264(-)